MQKAYSPETRVGVLQDTKKDAVASDRIPCFVLVGVFKPAA
jgi:hypothetical protein